MKAVVGKTDAVGLSIGHVMSMKCFLVCLAVSFLSYRVARSIRKVRLTGPPYLDSRFLYEYAAVSIIHRQRDLSSFIILASSSLASESAAAGSSRIVFLSLPPMGSSCARFWTS